MVFTTALSGIKAASKNLEIIGNNIANSGTAGFKKSRAEFADVYSSASIGGGANAVGGGVRLSSVHQDFGQSNMTFTNSSLDMGIDGRGFFVLSDQGAIVYSRAGAFIKDDDGYIVNAQGQRLQGFQADNAGQITGLSGDLRINETNISPNASTLVQSGFNLESNATPPAINWAGGATPSTDSYNNVSSTRIFDSLGNSHTLAMFFIKADASAALGDPNASSPPGTNNQWYVAFQIDNQDVPAVGAGGNTANLYRMNFNSDGSFASAQDTAGAALPNNYFPLAFNFGNGSDPLAMNVDLSDNTQFGSPFATIFSLQDGYTTGKFAGLAVNGEGVIFGRYSNGQAKALGQLQLANFASPEGLQPVGNTAWAETGDSGQPLVGAPQTASLGTVVSGALEDSNVDITEGLIGLIGAQRDFQANAQTIRTADAVTQTIINIR